jgi:hypothetical protein
VAGGILKNNSIGSVINPPPPAMVSTIPATLATTKSTWEPKDQMSFTGIPTIVRGYICLMQLNLSNNIITLLKNTANFNDKYIYYEHD